MADCESYFFDDMKTDPESLFGQRTELGAKELEHITTFGDDACDEETLQFSCVQVGSNGKSRYMSNEHEVD